MDRDEANENFETENVCVLCKKSKKKESCSSATDIGYATFIESTKNRKSKIDHKYGFFLDGYLSLCRADVRYHRKCYADFTNKTMISRLQCCASEPRHEPDEADLDELSNHTILSSLHELAAAATRESGTSDSASITKATDWSLCVMCQKEKANNKDHLRKVSTETAAKIETFAEIDNLLFHRIKDINLVHANAQLHGLCLIDLERRYKQKTSGVQKKQRAFNGLCVQLRIESANGKVFYSFLTSSL